MEINEVSAAVTSVCAVLAILAWPFKFFWDRIMELRKAVQKLHSRLDSEIYTKTQVDTRIEEKLDPIKEDLKEILQEVKESRKATVKIIAELSNMKGRCEHLQSSSSSD